MESLVRLVGLSELEVARVATFDVQLPAHLSDLLVLFIFFHYRVKVMSIHDRPLVHDILLPGLLYVTSQRDPLGRCRLDLRLSLALCHVPPLSFGTFGRILEDLLPFFGRAPV